MPLNRIDWLELAKKCYDTTGGKNYHVNELADFLIRNSLVSNLTAEQIAAKLSSSLASNVKGKSPFFVKVKNDKGGHRKGVYALKKASQPKRQVVESYSVATTYTGRAGEHAVLSELLFRGYNPSLMAVDEGIDIVAAKDGNYFHIQVKTTNGDDTKPYSTFIEKSKFQVSHIVFYVIVLRRKYKLHYENAYLVFPSSVLMSLVAQGVFKDGPRINFRIEIYGKTVKINGKHDVTHHLNHFDGIC